MTVPQIKLFIATLNEGELFLLSQLCADYRSKHEDSIFADEIAGLEMRFSKALAEKAPPRVTITYDSQLAGGGYSVNGVASMDKSAAFKFAGELFDHMGAP